jgi:hypothetical protein
MSTFLLIITLITPGGAVHEFVKLPPHATISECTRTGEANKALYLRVEHVLPRNFSYRCDPVPGATTASNRL